MKIEQIRDHLNSIGILCDVITQQLDTFKKIHYIAIENDDLDIYVREYTNNYDQSSRIVIRISYKNIYLINNTFANINDALSALDELSKNFKIQKNFIDSVIIKYSNFKQKFKQKASELNLDISQIFNIYAEEK
jgi:hypothetical protein